MKMVTPEINLEELQKFSRKNDLTGLKKQQKLTDNEDYEAASRFRDEINNRKEN